MFCFVCGYYRCPACGYWAFNGIECFDCGYRPGHSVAVWLWSIAGSEPVCARRGGPALVQHAGLFGASAWDEHAP
jgi:hypothetical protein